MWRADDVVAVIGHLAWPLVILFLAIGLRKELKGAIRAIAIRVGDRDTDVSITKGGLSLKRATEAIEARMTTVEAGQGQLNHVLLQRDGRQNAQPIEITDELREMARAYLAIEVPDRARRTMLKDSSANEMGYYVVAHRVSRDELAKEQDEGLVLALASAVLLDPQPQDAELLLNAAQHIRRRHVQYRILVAFTRLYERGLVTDDERDRLRTLLARYSVDADAPLRRQISYTSSLISSRVS